MRGLVTFASVLVGALLALRLGVRRTTEERRYEEDAHGDDPHEQDLSGHAHRLQALIADHLPYIERAARADLA